MKPAQSASCLRYQGGFVLVGVLVIVMLSSMVALSLMFHLRAEETAVAASAGGDQALAAAMSGVREAMRSVTDIPAGQLDWADSPGLFRDRLVFDDGSDRWYYSVFSAVDTEGEESVRFGLTSEAAKVNLNTATEEMLVKLPKVTPYLAEGLLDFIDTDAFPRPEGAEQEYYDALSTPFEIPNGPLSSLDQLLLVRGFTPAVLYGEDANLNFRLEANENDGDEQFPPDNRDGKLNLGLRPFLTISSYDINRDNDGVIRVNINDPAEEVASAGLPPAAVAYIAALRRNKLTVASPADLLEAKGSFKDESGKAVEMESGVGKAELAAILDRFTTTIDYHLPGKIDVNTAPTAVLLTVPGIDEAIADAITLARRNLRPEQRRTPAWLFEEGIVPADEFKKIAPYLTARSLQFHFHVIGYGIPSGRFRVLEAVIDVADATPAIIYLRDITRLGLPFEINLPDADDWDLVRTGPEERGIHAASARRAGIDLLIPGNVPSEQPALKRHECRAPMRVIRKTMEEKHG